MRIPSPSAQTSSSSFTGPQFLTAHSVDPAVSSLSSAPSALPFVVLAITIPMVIAASVVGCLWGRSKSSSSNGGGGGASRAVSSPTVHEPKSGMALQVAIPTSSLMDERMIDQAAQGNTTHRMSVLPPPSQPLAPPPAITRNAAVPEAQTQVNPALLVQLLHAQLHRQNDTNSSPTSPTRSNAPSGLVTPPDTPHMGGSTPTVGSPTAPNPAFLRDRTGSTSIGASVGAVQPSMILPDKTSLIRGNFEVPGIPTALPTTSTMGSNYGARHLVADWDHLYQTVLTTCAKLSTPASPSSQSPTSPTFASSDNEPVLRLVGQVAVHLMHLVRSVTTRQAGESLWCPLIYTHHDEYKNLPRATLLQPAEMYLAVHELMYDKPMADIVQQALAEPLAQCTRNLQSLLTRAGLAAQDAKALADPLPWATIAMVVRVKRYRPSMAFFEVSGTGQRPNATYFTVMNAGALTVRRRGPAHQGQGATSATMSTMSLSTTATGAADDDEFGALTTVAAYVWPGVLDLAESVVRIRARVLVSV